MRKRGFTLVELAFVLAVLGLLAGMTVPAYQQSVRRAQSAEAALLLEHIANEELAWRRDHGAFLACGAMPAQPPKGEAVAFDASGCWRDLGLRVEGPVRYSYRVELHGETFRAIAEGDLDGDGVRSVFTLDGAGLDLTVQDPLE